MDSPTTENCKLATGNSGTSLPILFTAEMTLKVLQDIKTHTRRAGKIQSEAYTELGVSYIRHATKGLQANATYRAYPNGGTARWAICACPYGIPGDHLWVRENWKAEKKWDNTKPSLIPKDAPIFYTADTPDPAEADRWGKTRPNIFMMRWMSRILLKITDVRIERLQDISEEDALAEGIKKCKNGYVAEGTPYDKAGLSHTCPTIAFAILWDSINGKRKGCTWADNPWVWVVQFERIKNHIVDPNKKVNAHDLIKPEVIDEVINTPLPLETKQILDHHNSGKEPQ